MLNIDSIHDGIVIDHIKAGMGMQIYKLAIKLVVAFLTCFLTFD